MKTQNLEIYNIPTDCIAYCEAEGLAKCFAAYANECAGEYINCVGLNQNSGYIYIALENGITICSMLGRRVEYLVTDFEDGEEYFFDEYDEAQNFDPSNKINEDEN